MKDDFSDSLQDTAAQVQKPTKWQTLWWTIRAEWQVLGLWFWQIVWKTLWALGLARFVQEMMCRVNIYQKYNMSGRCMYCGVVHGMHWKIERPDYGGLKKAVSQLTRAEYEEET